MLRKFEDTYRHKGMRNTLVKTITEKGISDSKVLNAINTIPRHFFLDSAFDNIAYEDRAFPITAGQTISQPYTVAFQTQLLNIKPFDKVLEIGSGSLYQASVLAELGARVFTIERQKELYDLYNKFYATQKYPSIKTFYGDGFLGLPNYAPFNSVIITAAAPFLPPTLISQIVIGGVIVVPLNNELNDDQTMIRYTKNEDGTLTEEKFETFKFVPMLQGKNK